MPTSSSLQITDRDREVLTSLLRDPKTPGQLLRESVVFTHAFHSLSRLQVRLKQLADAGMLKRWRYLDNGDGAAPYYYKLSPEGFRFIAGPDASPPSKRFFASLSPSLQRHSRALADVNIQTRVAAKRANIATAGFQPRGSSVIAVGPDRLIPDATWQLVPAHGRDHNFCFEIDCSTESGRSSSNRVNTLEQKIRRYEALHYECTRPFRVAFFFTQSRERMHNFIRLAGQLVRNRRRVIFYGITFADFMNAAMPLTTPIFVDQNGDPVSLMSGRQLRTSALADSRVPVYAQAPRR